MHIHAPDGVFPVYIWLPALIILIIILFISLIFLRKDKKNMVVTSALTALLLIVYSVEFFGFHLNFTALAGIILGPFWSVYSITMVNLFLSLFGHGGLTVSPLNILINWGEALIGYYSYRFLTSRFKDDFNKSLLSSLTVFFSLLVSFILFIGIVYLANLPPNNFLEDTNAGIISLNAFVLIMVFPSLISAVIESIFTFFIVRFILLTKPELLTT